MKSKCSMAVCFVLCVWFFPNAQGTTNFWDGGGANGFWSTSANWSNNVPAAAGQDLIFPSGVSRFINTNDFIGFTALRSLTFPVTGYVIYGNGVRLTNGLSATHATVFSSTVF